MADYNENEYSGNDYNKEQEPVNRNVYGENAAQNNAGYTSESSAGAYGAGNQAGSNGNAGAYGAGSQAESNGNAGTYGTGSNGNAGTYGTGSNGNAGAYGAGSNTNTGAYGYSTDSQAQNAYEVHADAIREIPVEEKKQKKSGKAGKVAKKAVAIVVSAALFGGVAAGTFQGVNYLTGYSAKNNAATANASVLLKSTEINTDGMTIKDSLDVSDIAESVMPSIVAITNKSVQEVQNYFSIFGYGGRTTQQETESQGSGIIIGKNDTELLVVTNYHVIEDAETLSVCCVDGAVYEAKVKGTDSNNDLAVIAVPLENISSDTMAQIKVISIGDSDSLKVGEQVVAIGNALGYGQSVTTGIVSATNRTISSSSSNGNDSSSSDSTDAQEYIQTDAAINPGNSGGALVNMKGELVGINSAKIAYTTVEGMGYAIPVSRVYDIIENLMNQTTRDKVSDEEKAVIGVTVTTVDDSINQVYGIPKGAYVSQVTENGPAQQGGIMAGDVITAFDGKTVDTKEKLIEILQYYKAGETVTVTVQTPGNGGYTERQVEVTLGQASSTK